MKAKKTIIAILLGIGMFAVCGEPTEDIATGILLQIFIFATTWGTATYLAHKWHMFNH